MPETAEIWKCQTDMDHADRIYFDYNATAPLLECARDCVVEILTGPGNASSVHHEGRIARKLIENGRVQCAALIGCHPANVIFTSGATEAASHALSPVIRSGGREISVSQLYVSATEHPCVLAGGRFQPEQVTILPVHENGLLDLEALQRELSGHDEGQGAAMVAVQFANNETGVVQPVREIADIVHSHDAFLVVDAVQALGKIPFAMEETGADFLFVSSHKIGGPQGVGALVLANGSLSPKPFLTGGGQENFHRAGTENVAAIAGFGAACEWHHENLSKNIQKYVLRDSIEAGIGAISQEAGNCVAAPVFFGKGSERLGNTSCFAVPGIRAETALMALDLEGISVSSGSACSSGKVKQSHVLEAMGASPQEMEGALRVSLGWNSTGEEVEHFLGTWKTIIGRMAA